MLGHQTEDRIKEIDLPSTEVPPLPSASLTTLDTLALAECLQVPLSEKDKLLHTRPIFLYPKNGLSGLL